MTFSLLGISVLIYVLQLISQFTLGIDLPAMLGMKVNSYIVAGEYWRLITPVVLHGSLLHIGFNMYALHLIGRGIESRYGHARFLALYLLSGFAGNVFSLIFSTAPSLGSSTAIFGLLAAQGVFVHHNRAFYGNRARHVLQRIAYLAAINLLIGLSPGIDNWGHIGGLLGGTLFAWFAGPQLRLDGIYPSLSYRDQRGPRQVISTALGVGLLFALLAFVTIVLRGG
jgi:rhomboid protease GluP